MMTMNQQTFIFIILVSVIEMLAVVIFALYLAQAMALVTNKVKPYRLQPVHENFFLDVAEDPIENTPQLLLGEARLKNFVATYDKNALVNGGGLGKTQYNIIERVRALKLLKVTAESGLIEVLEEKGLSLSKIEALLPLADNLGLLSLLNSNKDLVLSAAPLLIEPAPAILPLLVGYLRSSPTTFFGLGFALLGAGAYETTDSLLFGAPLILLGLPISVLGIVLSVINGVLDGPVPNIAPTFRALPETTVNAPSISASSVSRPMAQKKRAPVDEPAPKAAKASRAPAAKATGTGGALNGKRKTVKLKF